MRACRRSKRYPAHAAPWPAPQTHVEAREAHVEKAPCTLSSLRLSPRLPSDREPRGTLSEHSRHRTVWPSVRIAMVARLCRLAVTGYRKAQRTSSPRVLFDMNSWPLNHSAVSADCVGFGTAVSCFCPTTYFLFGFHNIFAASNFRDATLTE